MICAWRFYPGRLVLATQRTKTENECVEAAVQLNVFADARSQYCRIAKDESTRGEKVLDHLQTVNIDL